MTRVRGDGAGRSLSMACLDSQAKERSLPLTSGEFWGKVIFRCALNKARQEVSMKQDRPRPILDFGLWWWRSQ